MCPATDGDGVYAYGAILASCAIRVKTMSVVSTRIRVNLPVAFVLVCTAYALAILVGCRPDSLLGKALMGLPILLGDFLGVLWILRARHICISPAGRRMIAIPLLALFAGLLAAPISWLTSGTIYPLYIVSDAAWVLWVCLNLVVFTSIWEGCAGRLRQIGRVYAVLCGFLLLWWIGESAHHGVPTTPHVLLFSFVLSGLAVAGLLDRARSSRMVFYLAACLLLLAAGFLGWARGLFVGYVFAFGLWLLMIFHPRNARMFSLVSCMLALGLGLSIAWFAEDLGQSRLYSTLANKEVVEGESATERLDEARNAYMTLQSIPGAFLTGLGHGAVYFPYLNVGSISRNITDEGYVHNIHVGPALLFFRYGVVGIVLYLYFWWIVLRGFRLGRRLAATGTFSFARGAMDSSSPVRLFYASYFLFCALFIYSHFGNHFVDPFFGFSLALTIMFICRPGLLSDTKRMQVVRVALSCWAEHEDRATALPAGVDDSLDCSNLHGNCQGPTDWPSKDIP